MAKIKSIPAKDVEKLIASIEKSYKSILQRANEDHHGSHSMALGQAEVVIETIIKQLKGDFPI